MSADSDKHSTICTCGDKGSDGIERVCPISFGAQDVAWFLVVVGHVG